ncbi:hypothetical protein C815_00428 [Firmicutes bacterium M10-2]|nr:hypothetical protein C815_00428 [Firmicutes bacterium M10-2]
MKKRAYIVRHGQTKFNVEKRCQGWKDSPLTQKGRQQAWQVHEYFSERGIRFDHAYSSDLQRAIDTMLIIVQGENVPCFTTPGLREMSFGKYDGWKHHDIPDVDRNTFFKSVGGETAEEAIVRAYRTIVQIMNRQGNDQVLFVSHGIPVSGLFYSLARKEGIEEVHDFRNGCILVYEVDGYDMELIDFIQTEREEFLL